MKPLYYTFFLAFGLFAFSCGGDEGSSNNDSRDDDTVNDTSAVDSLDVAALTFEDVVEVKSSLTRDPEGLDSFLVTFEAAKAQLDQEQLDSSFMMYLDHLNVVAREEHDFELNSQDEFDRKKSKFGPYGFQIHGSEGFYWLQVDRSIALNHFEGALSKDLKEYARLDEIMAAQHAADAGMLHSYDEWLTILLDLEDRVIANKNSRFYTHFINAYNTFLYNFMWGMDNTPTTTWEEPKSLEVDVKAAYDRAMADKKHKTGLIIEQHVKNLEAANYDIGWENQWQVSNQEIEDYLFE